MRTAFFFLVVLAWLTAVGLHVAVHLGWYSSEFTAFAFMGFLGGMIVFSLVIAFKPTWERPLLAPEVSTGTFDVSRFFQQRPLWAWMMVGVALLYLVYMGILYDHGQGGFPTLIDGQYVIRNHGKVLHLTRAQYDQYVHAESMLLTAIAMAVSTVAVVIVSPPPPRRSRMHKSIISPKNRNFYPKGAFPT